MSTGSIKFRGIKLDIEFEATQYVPAKMYETNGDPGSPEEGGDFDIYEVLLNGVNIMELLDEQTIEEIGIQYQEENDLFGDEGNDEPDWGDDIDWGD
jgi:hypothetical protein